MLGKVAYTVPSKGQVRKYFKLLPPSPTIPSPASPIVENNNQASLEESDGLGEFVAT